MGKEFTEEQVEVIKHILGSNRSLVINAVAGSGKTTTIVEAAKRLPEGKNVAFLAFNKDIADELRSRLPSRIHASTMNSLGLKSVLKAMPRATVSGTKLYGIFGRIEKLYALNNQFVKRNKKVIIKLVSIGKTNGIIPNLKGVKKTFIQNTPENWKKMFFSYGLELKEKEDLDLIIKTAMKINEESLKLSPSMIIDFDDQIVLPVIYDWAMPKFDILFLDETQDISELKCELVFKALSENGKIVAVGDPKQCIYGFAGAREGIMESIKERTMASTLTLSYTFRCGKNIVLEAQKISPSIRCLESSHDGLVKDLGLNYEVSSFNPGDMILCRTNAPLMTMAVNLFEQGKAFQFTGNIEFVDKAKDALKKVPHMKGSEIRDSLKETIRSLKEQLSNGQNVSADLDVANFIMSLCKIKSNATGETLISKINDVFSEGKSNESVRLFTIHKAKGLEADRVYFLNNKNIPHESAKTAWELEQEENIRYVGVTRAREELIYIDLNEDEAA